MPRSFISGNTENRFLVQCISRPFGKTNICKPLYTVGLPLTPRIGDVGSLSLLAELERTKRQFDKKSTIHGGIVLSPSVYLYVRKKRVPCPLVSLG